MHLKLDWVKNEIISTTVRTLYSTVYGVFSMRNNIDPTKIINCGLVSCLVNSQRPTNEQHQASLNSVIVNLNFLGNDENISDKDFVKEAFNILTGD